jgi:PAS domain-containing protein
MAPADNTVTSIISRVALLVALTVTLALPLGYWIIAYRDFSGELEFKARVKATALSGLIAALPEVWMYAENRLQGLLAREPVPLDTEAIQVYDDRGNLLAQAGEVPAPPVLRRSYLVYDATRVAGRSTSAISLREIVRHRHCGRARDSARRLGIHRAADVSLRAAAVTDALFEQKQRAEVTLRSIGDAVITTDAAGRVEFLNPVAERLSGWSFSEAKDRPLTEILHLIDATTGDPVATSCARRSPRTASSPSDATSILSGGTAAR